MNATEKKLISYLEQKNEYPWMVQNEMELFTNYFIRNMETSIELYATKCQPIIEDQLPIPVLAQRKSDQLLNGNRTFLIPSLYAKEMRNITESLLKDKASNEQDYFLDSDGRGDTEKEVENLLRLYPDGLDFKANGGLRILQCRNVKSLLFVPIILKLKKELGRASRIVVRHDGAARIVADEQFVIDRLFTRLKVPLESTPMKELYDERCVLVFQRMHTMGLITTRDIVSVADNDRTRYFYGMFRDKSYFSKHRFRFLSTFCPTRLVARHDMSPQQQQIAHQIHEQIIYPRSHQIQQQNLARHDMSQQQQQLAHQIHRQQQQIRALYNPNQQQQQQQQQLHQTTHRNQDGKIVLSQEAKQALTKAIWSALRSPTGEIDPALMLDALKSGIPKHAILNAALLARERDAIRRCQPVTVFLHLAAEHPTMDAFRCVFATGLSLYPNMVGINLLHQKDPLGKSPYRMMCEKHGKKATGTVIRETLQSYNTTPYNPIDAFVYAATKNKIRLDGVYSILRTHPDILQLLLASDVTTTSAAAAATTTNCGTTTVSFPLSESKRKDRKRKR